MKIEDEIREVAEQHQPDGGYGDTAWNPETKTVLWVPADWTEIEEEAAAHDAFLDIPGVENVEGDAEQGVPKDDPWVRIADNARMQERWDEHEEAYPFAYMNGKIWIGDPYEGHHDIPDDMIMAVEPNAWPQDSDIYFGRVFDDGEVVSWYDKPIPEAIQEQIRQKAIEDGDDIQEAWENSQSKFAWNPFKNQQQKPEQYQTPEEAPITKDLGYVDKWDGITPMRYSWHPQTGLYVWPEANGYHRDWMINQGMPLTQESDSSYAGGVFDRANLHEYHAADPWTSTQGIMNVSDYIVRSGFNPPHNVQGGMNVKQANIFDPIQPTLDQRVFSGINPKPTIAHFITSHFYQKMDELLVENPEQYFDLTLTGSLTTYQYSDSSDCDISVFVHYDDLMDELGLGTEQEVRRELIHLVTTELDGTPLPGSQHPLQFFIIPPGQTIYNYFRPGMRSGYSFNEKGWLVPPEKKRVHDIASEMPEVYSRAAQMADKLTVLLDSGDIEAAKDMFAQIHKKRGDDEMAGLGDFSEGNIVYKYLLHEGLFDRLRSEAGVRIANFKLGNYEEKFFNTDAGSVQETPYTFVYINGKLFTGLISHNSVYHEIGVERTKGAVDGLYLPRHKYVFFYNHFGEVDPLVKEEVIQKLNRGETVTVSNTKTADIEVHGEREPIYYDFDRDKIIAKHDFEMARAGKIIGEYDGHDVFLHGTSQEWINPGYFKRLWVATWPHKPLNKIHMDGAAIQTRPADAMTYTQKLPFLVHGSEFDAPLHSPVNYQYVPLTENEVAGYLTDPTKQHFHNKAQGFNRRAGQLGNDGRVKGQELYGLTQRYQGNCAYCGNPGADSYDHVIPLKNGGRNSVENLLPVHIGCNKGMNDWDLSLTPVPQTFNMSPKWTGPDYQAEAHVAKDPWRKGKDWKEWIKNEGIIVDFQIGDEDDDPIEGRVKEINKDSLKIEIDPGEFRTFDDEFMKQIKFKVRDDKRSLSHWKEGKSFDFVGDCPYGDCDYEFNPADHYDVKNAGGWFTCPQCNRTTNVRTEFGHKTSAS